MMPEREEEDVIRRIEALLAKTKSNGCTEAEAAAATGLAAKLMLKYGIQQEKLGRKTENQEHRFSFSRGNDEWQRLVAGGVAKKFGCACYADFDSIVFFGKDEAPKGAGITWSWLVNEMPRVALREKAWQLKNLQRYMMGMATMVCVRLNTKDNSETGRFAIVRADTADEEMMKAHPDLEDSKEISKKIVRQIDSAEFLLGMIHGSKVALDDNKAIEN